jgi:hypothetical protein
LTDAEKAKYGIPKKPLSYEKYIGLLDIDTYKRTHDPKLFLVMRFTLGNMQSEDQLLKRDDFLRVYEAQVGLEQWAVRAAKSPLACEDAMRLLKAYSDERLFDLLPPPRATDKAYIAFLVEQANAEKWSIYSRQKVHKLLVAFDPKTYRPTYRQFLLANVKTAKDGWERANLYDGLIEFKDEETLKATADGLLHDPVTECRESILSQLRQQGEVASVIDAVVAVVEGKGDPHGAVMPGRSANQWDDRLRDYLKWAKALKTLDKATAEKVDQAIAKLAEERR